MAVKDYSKCLGYLATCWEIILQKFNVSIRTYTGEMKVDQFYLLQ